MLKPQAFVFRVQISDAGDDQPLQRLFATRATTADEALATMRTSVPDNWIVELTDYRLTMETTARLGLRRGEARSLTDEGCELSTRAPGR